MKLNILYIFVVLLLTIYKSNADICQNCLNKGDLCTAKFSETSDNGTIIESYQFIGNCQSGLVCGPLNTSYVIPNKVDWICREYGKKDRSCYNGLTCEFGLVCNRKQICIQGNFTQLGDGCVRDSDCSGYFPKCINEVCQKYKNQCFTNNDCSYNQLCNSQINQCVDYLFEGDDCNTKNDFCFTGLKCLSSGVCGKEYLGLGNPCSIENSQCDVSKGYYCSPKSLICETFIAPNTKNCSVGINQCGDYYTCSCDGQCYPNKPSPIQTSPYQALVDCAYDNKCQMINNINSNQSCVFQKCQRELCDYKKLYYQSSKISCDSEFLISKYCSNINNSSVKISIFSISTILLILLISLLF
ncbi:hypothetical protein RB653_005100 [Dictyostelium firmibasis]|uniref:Transmembrane protein n=1 Tax=Dictyostelium firmibasis TaxID=79012 RepID=A0AAN7YSR2_9MYCE